MPAQRTIHIGLAGWSNPPREQAARAAGQSHLQHYASRFDCVEINSSFYRPHRPDTYRRWRDETPDAFRFSAKMPKRVTHDAGLRRCTADVARFYGEVASLRPKLAVILVQLPPRLEFSRRTVRAFFSSLPRTQGVGVVCEPRHVSWFTQAADETLRELRVARVAADPARGVDGDRPGGCRSLAYFRWHGSPRLYYSAYAREQLTAFAAATRRSAARHTWCIFDNTARYAAWDDAACFSELRDARETGTP